MSKLETNTIAPSTGTTLTLGESGDTITVPSGVTLSGFGANTPAFLAGAGTATNLTNVSNVLVTYNTEYFDTDNAYDTSTSKFTVPSGKGGKYFFSVGLRQDSWTSNRFILTLIKNNSTSLYSQELSGGVSGAMTVTLSVITDLIAGDYITVFGYQDSGSTRTNATGVEQSWFSGYKLIG